MPPDASLKKSRMTEARVVILDPNADFKYLKELSTGSNNQGDKPDPQFVARWRQISKQIGVAAPDGTIWGSTGASSRWKRWQRSFG